MRYKKPEMEVLECDEENIITNSTLDYLEGGEDPNDTIPFT